MVKTSIPKANVKSDFLNVITHKIKKTYAAQLLKQWKSGNLKFTVSKTIQNDGETSFLPENSRGIKKSTVTIKRKVAMSKHVCWRMSSPFSFMNWLMCFITSTSKAKYQRMRHMERNG